MKKGRVILFLLSVMMVFAFSSTAFAAGSKKQALKAYDIFLENEAKKSDCEFDRWGLACLDKDNIPELIVYKSKAPTAGIPGIYTFRKNKVVKLSANYGNAYYTHYYKNTCVLKGGFVNSSSDYVCYYSFNPKKEATTKDQNLVMLFYKEGGKYYVYLSEEDYAGTAISKKEFNSLVKKVVGGTKATKIKYYKNTAKNRKKHLK